ncbi:AAA family ATPase [Teredinibacter turnerae]|uniref:AAA family ATPase n=1 Tax=Teredinibacter turnerae TaxID=2426 RepID=UPI0005F8407D
MYHNHFGLQEQAFSIAVNPRYLYMSQQHKEALAHLLYGVKGGGFVLLSGEVGTGKTTIIRCLLERLPDATDVAIVMNPMDDAIQMLCTICDELGAPYDKSALGQKPLVDSLNRFLLENHRNGHNTVLLIDEAQRLSAEALEQIRLLTNLETTTQKLLQIILVGQPELNETLAQPRLRQLSQRITARFHLQPLTLLETQAYIAHRLDVAGLPDGRNPFPGKIVRKIHQFTGGIPRLINIVCERALIGAYGHNKSTVDLPTFNLACAEVAGSLPGHQHNHSRVDPRLLAAGGVALVLLAIIAIGVWLIRAPVQSPMATAPATVIAPTEVLAPVPAATPTPTPEATPIIASHQPEPAATPSARPATPSYLIASYTEAQARLVQYLGFRIDYDTHPCWELADKNIQCTRESLETWPSLQEINRPAVLILITPARFASHAVIVGLNSTEAELLDSEGRAIRVPLSELGPLWTGRIMYLWSRPEGFSEPLVMGQKNPAISWLAKQFALLDERPSPLTDDRFNANLRERVKIFQRTHGLEDDGIIGARTLMKVNEVLGIDQTLRSLD